MPEELLRRWRGLGLHKLPGRGLHRLMLYSSLSVAQPLVPGQPQMKIHYSRVDCGRQTGAEES